MGARREAIERIDYRRIIVSPIPKSCAKKTHFKESSSNKVHFHFANAGTALKTNFCISCRIYGIYDKK
jgi:hypothetical protein